MYCKYCGQPIPEGGYCNCENAVKARNLAAGKAPQSEQNSQTAQKGETPGAVLQPKVQPVAQTAPAGPATAQSPKAPKEKKPINPNIIRYGVAGVIVLVVVIAVIALFSTRRTTINLNDYLTVEFNGYDTIGTLDWEFDLSVFEEEYEETLRKNLKKTMEKEYGQKLDEEIAYLRGFTGDSDLDFYGLLDFYGETASEIFYYESVDFGFSKYSDLSNGDVIELTWDNDDDEILGLFNVNVKYENIEYTVSGLEEIRIVDVFEGMDVVFDGISTAGTAEIVSGDIANAYGLSYGLSKNSGLSNGEMVTVTVNAPGNTDLDEYCLSNYGIIPSAAEKEFTVNGLKHYVTSISEISSSALSAMQSQAEDVYYSNIAQRNEDGETFLSLNYIGGYLLTSKTDESVKGVRNYYYLIYKANYLDEYSNDDQAYSNVVDVYWYIRYTDLVADDFGETDIDVMDYQSSFNVNDKFTVDTGISYGWLNTKKWTYNGYETLDDLYRVVVAAQMEKFSHEDAVEDIPTADRSAAAAAVTEDEIEAETEADEEAEAEETENEEAGFEATDEAEADAEDEAAMQQPEFPGISSSDGFIFPDSDTRLITSAEAAVLSDDDLRYAINEIYARHGYIFENQELLDYFRQFDWYQETAPKSRFNESVFNSYERANIDLLSSERNRR